MSLEPPRIQPNTSSKLEPANMLGGDVASMQLPQHLHPSSLLFEAASIIRRYIIPAAIGMAGAAQGAVWGAAIAVCVVVVTLVVTVVHYFTLRYQIKNNEFVVTEGLLFRRVRVVPIHRIQNVDLVQNVLHRLFGVAEVNIETASGTKPEATLRVLTHKQINELRSALFALRADANVSEHPSEQSSDVIARPDSTTTADSMMIARGDRVTHPSQPVNEIYSITLRDLFYAGLTSNRGMVLLGILAGLYFQGGYESRWNPDFVESVFQESQDAFTIVLLVSTALLALVLLLRILGISWYILRFYGYRLTRCGDDLRISCGLLTRVSATVPRKRVQFISVHRPLLMRWLGLASIRIETAGGSGSENENAATTVSRRWFLPVVAETEVNRILDTIRPGIDWNATSQIVTWHGVSPRTEQRLLRLSLVLTLLFSMIGLAFTRPWGWAAGPVLFPFLMFLVRKKSRAKRYARTEWGIAYQSGWLTRKLSFAFYDKIQTLQILQSPFDRRWQMATLSVDTAAAGPAEHSINVRYLEQDFAFLQFDDLQVSAAQHRPSWA